MTRCPACDHEWSLHAGATPWLVMGCGECLSEEDHGERADVCLLLAPEDEQGPAGLRLHARLQRRRVHGDRILIEDGERFRWAEIPSAGDADLGGLLASIEADLKVLPPIPFAKRYRRWMAARSFGAALADKER
jgi:hypothetical protein